MAKKSAPKKTTSPKVAKKASKVLKSSSSGKSSKSAAGSALSQSKSPKKKTSKEAAKKASKVLKDGRTSKASKSAAGSALSQRKKKLKELIVQDQEKNKIIMKLSEYKNAFYTFTGKLSDINRQIAFAGIALIWIFKKTNGNEILINSELVFPAILLALSLGVDMLQYIYQSIAWALFHRKNEKIKTEDDPELLASPIMNYPSWLFFSLKILFVIIAYINIIDFLVDKLLK